MMLTPNDGNDNRNLIIAILLAIVILVGFESMRAWLFPTDPAAVSAVQNAPTSAEPATQQATLTDGLAAEQPQALQIVQIPIENSVMRGEMSLQGGRITQLELLPFQQSLTDASPYKLFERTGPQAHTAEFGWLGQGVQGADARTQWQIVSGEKLTPTEPLILQWQNNSGQTFERKMELDARTFAIKVTDRITNNAELPVTFSHYTQIHQAGGLRAGEESTFYHHVGPEGWLREEKIETDYEDLQDGSVTQMGTGGWWGMSSQYFLTAIVPDTAMETTRQFRYRQVAGQNYYTASVQSPVLVVPVGGSKSYHSTLYAGPQLVGDLAAVAPTLTEAVDYGFFALLAKPIAVAMRWFHQYLGNWGLAIIAVTILLKIITFPLAHKSYKAMAKLKKLQPEMMALKEKYGEDERDKMAMAMIGLYKTHKVNPMSGCWPILIQMPFFLAMYKVILVSFEFRHAPLFGWIQDLSAQDPLYILPVLMGASMWFQMRLNPQSPDPMQAKIMQWMPVVFTVFFLWFPSGLVLYWLTNNLFSIAQQWLMLKKEKAL